MIKGLELLEYLTPEVRERLIKSQEQIHQLHDVLSVTRLDKQNAMVRRLVKKTQDGTLGQATTESDEKAGEESVDDTETDKVNFGDVTTTYNIADKAPETTKKTNSVLPIVLAAALGGTGLGAAAMTLPYILRSQPATVTQPQTVDTNTQYDLGFKEETKP